MNLIYEPKGRAREYSELALNIYTGCSHGCTYCYAPRILHTDRESFHHEPKWRENVLTMLEKDLQEMCKKGDKRKVLMCFTCDPYQGDFWFKKLTRDCLELFRKYVRPFQILTKGGMKAVRDFDLYSKQDSFGTSLTFSDQVKSMQFEPNAARPIDRKTAIYRAYCRGIDTWVSFEPVIDPEQVYELFDATREYVNLYKIGKISGCPEIEKEIDWQRFAETMIEKCEKYGKKYYLKDDLRKCLGKDGE